MVNRGNRTQSGESTHHVVEVHAGDADVVAVGHLDVAAGWGKGGGGGGMGVGVGVGVGVHGSRFHNFKS